MATGKKSSSREAYSQRYKTTIYASNRKRKLQRLIKEQPNNTQLTMALSDIHYRRKTPKTTAWSATAKREAMILKDFKASKSDTAKSLDQRNMFALNIRAKNKGKYIIND